MRVLPGVLVVLALLALGWDRVAEARAHDDAEVRDDLARLRARAAALDAHALQARFAELESYDPLVDDTAALRSGVARLALDVAPGTDAAAKLAAFGQALDGRSRDIEGLKSQRGALTNTERALPGVLDEARAVAGADMEEVEADLVQFLLSPTDGKLAMRLTARRDALAASPAGRSLAPHLTVLLRGHDTLDQLTPKLIDDPLAARADALARAELARRAARERVTAAIRLALLVALAALAALGLWQRR